MKRLLVIVSSAIAGFVLFALCGYAAVQLLSSNAHDRAVEAAMTALFVAGPLGGVVGAIAGARFSRRAQPEPAAQEGQRDTTAPRR